MHISGNYSTHNPLFPQTYDQLQNSIICMSDSDNNIVSTSQLEIVVVEDMFPVMVKDALVTSHPVSPNINHPDEIAESFDQISYNKV